ncbi:MAG TPA: hypothetical protein VF190_07140 [Rhodothermales bacterium]
MNMTHHMSKGGWLSGRLFAAAIAVVAFLSVSSEAFGQEGSSIPPEYRGTERAVARGILDGNLIETNFRNHGELARWNDNPWGIWPRGIGGRHIDGIAVVVAGLVRGERDKWSHLRPQWAGLPDTLLNPVSINYRDAGKKVGPDGNLWGWLPLGLGDTPGFHNPNRVNQVTGAREPNPALNDDPTTWPAFWPDKLDEEDSGWANDEVDGNPGVAAWNGAFGKGIFNADLESYYVMDDYVDKEYHIDPATGQPFSQYGVYYPDPSDSTKGGMGLQMSVRIFQWANVLAEDTMFLIYRITNTGQTDHGNQEVPGDPRETGLWFTQFVDYGLGFEEGDENAAFNPQLDIAYGYDQDGIGTREVGSNYNLGYTGFAFLESPANRNDGLDNDEDGITDEDRFSGPGMMIEGQAEIQAYIESNYNVANFIAWNATEGASLQAALDSRRAYRAGVWFTGDENLDWVGLEDRNGNGSWDPGELLNDDYGRDGAGPFDLGYSGPDDGEGDGQPTPGEPNFDQLDVDESDQIGLTGFDLNSRPFYENGDNLRDDQWMWERIRISQFPVGTEPEEQITADVEPFLNFSSGPVNLPHQSTDFFSTAWLFGADEDDFFNNRRVVQQIYNADYRFAQPPNTPTLHAQVGDGYVILSWDTLALASFDRFSQQFDFEGFKLYKGTDPLLSDARLITDFRGTPTFYKPLAQWDLVNEHSGRKAVLGGDVVYNLGDNTGLQFSYIDRNVINGKTYYYALVAYDHGFDPGADSPDPNAEPIDPQETTFNISLDQGGQLRGFSQNVAIVVPRADAAGFVAASTNEDLSRPTGSTFRTEPLGTGSASVTVVNPDQVPDGAVFRLSFFDTTETGAQVYETVGYMLQNVTTGETLIERSALRSSTPVAAGITIDIQNDEPALDPLRSGWVGVGSDGQPLISTNPLDLQGYHTNWVVSIEDDESTFARNTTDQYELLFTTDSLYSAPRFTGGYIQADIPVWCINTTKNTECGLLVFDADSNEVFGPEDDLIINERQGAFGQRMFRNVISFNTQGQESFPPQNGARIKISKLLPFATGDYFEFTIKDAEINTEVAKSEMEQIAVVPNPYMLAAEWEPRTQIAGRGPRMIQFINLPQECTIRIFTVRGELVRTLEHNGVGGDGAEWWDLKTSDDQDIAYGMYLYHVEAPGVGEHTGKFAIVK